MTDLVRMPRSRSVRCAFPVALATLALLLGCTVAAAQDADPLDGFDAYVSSAVESWGAPGLAVAVVHDGETVFARGYGTRSLDEGGEVDTGTLFAIGSTTKAMTAASIGMLVDEGALAWDDRVIDHMPWFRLRDPYATREVRVRDLLTHRAGLGNADYLWYEQDATTRDIVERLRHVEPAYSLRSGFIYQNIMYAAAGLLIETVSGMSWEDFVRERIFEPLEMDRTVATLAEAEGVDNVARPHDEVDGEVEVIENASVDPVAPAGSVWSSVNDMSRWLAFLLQGCETPDGRALVEPGTCAELFRPQTMAGDGFYPTTRLTKPHWTTYGLAWFQHDYEGRKVDFHTGSIDGMVAIAGLLRDEGVGVYVLSNRDHVELRHALMYRVFDLYDPDEPRDWSADLKELYEELAQRRDSARRAHLDQRVPGTDPSVPTDRLAGTYSDPLYGTVRVETVQGEAELRVRYGNLEGDAEHWHYDTFRVQWDSAWRGEALATFRLDQRGRVARLEVGSRVFHRERPDPEEAGAPAEEPAPGST